MPTRYKPTILTDKEKEALHNAYKRWGVITDKEDKR